VAHRNHLIAAALAAAAIATPAAAGPAIKPANGRVLLLLPLKLTKVDDLSFGTIVSSSTAGTVTINAVTGARTHNGGIMEVGSDPGQRALFAWAGTANQRVDFDITYPTSLDDGAGHSVGVALLYLQSATMFADQFGVVEVGVGGSILIGAGQPDGLYSNTFDVTANYQ
jgi:hypothetical protein